MKFEHLLCTILIIALSSGDAGADSAGGGLFDSDSVLELHLQVEFNKLCRPRETPDCDYIPSVLEYMDGEERQYIPIEIKVRGGWRSLSENCDVPLLWIRFQGEQLQGTPFEGQESLPLTTHCGRTSLEDGMTSSRSYLNYEQYLLKEYLAYRLYGQISDMSLRVRLVRVLYEDPDRTDRGNTNYAFFTEHFDSLAQRSGTELLGRGSFDPERLDQKQADLVALFQFMVGNTDWSLVRQRNAILLQGKDGVQIPVPYDLDMSGLVDAPYAGPPPLLPIDEVTERYYLGFCHPDINWTSLFTEFLSRRNQLQAQVENIPGMYKKERASARHYLRSFFRILNSAKKREKKIIAACQPWPPVEQDHMTPEDERR